MFCPYCSAENAEGEVFCFECGRPLTKQEKKKKETGLEKYRIEDNAIFYLSKKSISIEEELKDVLYFPDAQQYINGKYNLIFYNMQGFNLPDYLKRSSDTRENEIRTLGERMLYIFNKIQKKALLVGSCDLEDFFFLDCNPEKMVLRAVRPLISLKEPTLPTDYECGEFAAPEIRNEDTDRIKKSTDVYLAAMVLNRIMIGEKYITGDIDSQIFWAYNYTNGMFGKQYRKYHHWLGKCLSMFPGKRERDIEACMKLFEKCSNMDVSQGLSELNVSDAIETNIGSGKKASMQSAGRDKAEWNEDVIEKWENIEKGFTAYLLADGISNCDIGSGYIASNIIRKNFIRVMEEHINKSLDDLTYDIVEQMAYQIVDLSNADIWKEALKFGESSGSIMGSTLLFLVIFEGGLYYYSLGDSLLYLIRDGNMIPLNSPDNVGFLALRNGKSYAEYRKIEEKDDIAIYVGGDFARNQSRHYEERSVETIVLKDGDIIIASSDGVLDYYGAKISDTRWEKEATLAQKLTERKKTLQQRAQAIIKRDNRNGGGDNLSVILIEVEGGKDNE